jgi:hypothetical protein
VLAISYGKNADAGSFKKGRKKLPFFYKTVSHQMRKRIFNVGMALATMPWFAAMVGPPEITIEEIIAMAVISAIGGLITILSKIRIKR